jgi:UDP-N-acetylmuramoylalanine--D-glutamate ligase
MIPVTTFAGRHVALFGLGGSGLATAKALIAGGARVSAWDDGAASRDKAQAAGVTLVDLRGLDWSDISALVLSPGVPLTHPAPHWSVDLARAAGIEVIGDIELFCRERAQCKPQPAFVAITGTNGKSTTTALIAHILREAGRDVQMGGNIGTPILELAPMTAERVYVIECSSFQIDLAPSLQATVGVHLNLSPDHLDRHGTMEAYAAIKEQLVTGAKIAVVGVDDAMSLAIAQRRGASGQPVICISAAQELSQGVFARGRQVVWRREGRESVLADLTASRTLRGAHNAQNAAAALTACMALRVPADVMAQAVLTFPGLPHRMEEVGRRGRVLFLNDSKATNADSTEKALAAFADGIFWIAGGKAKSGGIESLKPLFDRVEEAFLIGEASEMFAKTLAGEMPVHACDTLDVAVARAAQAAADSEYAQPVVLLSPACASYDQFANFEARGNAFRALVSALPDETNDGRASA